MTIKKQKDYKIVSIHSYIFFKCSTKIQVGVLLANNK